MINILLTENRLYSDHSSSPTLNHKSKITIAVFGYAYQWPAEPAKQVKRKKAERLSHLPLASEQGGSAYQTHLDQTKESSSYPITDKESTISDTMSRKIMPQKIQTQRNLPLGVTCQ